MATKEQITKKESRKFLSVYFLNLLIGTMSPAAIIIQSKPLIGSVKAGILVATTSEKKLKITKIMARKTKLTILKCACQKIKTEDLELKNKPSSHKILFVEVNGNHCRHDALLLL